MSFKIVVLTINDNDENTIVLFNKKEQQIYRNVVPSKWYNINDSFNVSWFYWYVTNKTTNVQRLVGYLRVGDDSQRFKEFDRRVSMSRNIIIKNIYSSSPPPVMLSYSLTDTLRIIKKTQAHHYDTKNWDDYFAYMEMPIGATVPVIALAQIARNVIVINEEVVYKQMMPRNEENLYQLLHGFSVNWIRKLTYTIDRTEDNEQTQYFNCPTWFPDFMKAGYDCKDGALFVISLLWALKRSTTFKHAIKSLLNEYRICYTFGTMNKQGHAWVTLVDKRYFEPASSCVHPCISIETTANLALTETSQYNTISTLIVVDFDDDYIAQLIFKQTRVDANEFFKYHINKKDIEILHKLPPHPSLFHCDQLPQNIIREKVEEIDS